MNAPMSATSDAVDLEGEMQEGPDPMLAIDELQQQSHQQQFETHRRAQQAADSERSAATETSESTTSGQQGETGQQSTSSGDQGTGGGKRPGFDETLQLVRDQLGPEHEAVIRGVQSNYFDGRTQAREMQSMQSELQDSLDEVNALRDQLGQRVEEESLDPNDPINDVTPEQWDLFERMAASRGYVQQSDLEEQDAENQVRDYLDQDRRAGIERWGDEFGQLDANGQFQFNENVHAEAEEHYHRVTDPERGPSGQDLFKIARYDQDVQAAYERGQQEAQQTSTNGQAQRTQQARRAITERRSAPSQTGTEPSIYTGPDSGATLEDVVARASAVAIRELPNLPE